MVDVSLIQPVSQIATAIGVCIAAIYYVINLRISQKNQEVTIKTQKQTLETRQIQALLEINQERTTLEVSQYFEFMSATWVDFNDYYKKYGVNSYPEMFIFSYKLWSRYNISGLMVRDGLVSVNAYIEYLGDAVAIVWEKYKDIIIEYRRLYHLPSYLIGFEYLANEINRYRVEKGWGVKTPHRTNGNYPG